MEEKPKKTVVVVLRKTLFIGFIILLGIIMLGAVGSMVLTVMMKMEHPKGDKQEQNSGDQP